MSLATCLSSRRLVQMLLDQMMIQSQKMMTKMTFLHKETHNPMCFQGNQFIQSVIDGIPSEPNIQSIIMVTIYTDSECGTIHLYMLTMVTFNLKERERCNGQVSIIDSSHFIIHTITLLCHYDVIKKCSRDTKRCRV